MSKSQPSNQQEPRLDGVCGDSGVQGARGRGRRREWEGARGAWTSTEENREPFEAFLWESDTKLFTNKKRKSLFRTMALEAGEGGSEGGRWVEAGKSDRSWDCSPQEIQWWSDCSHGAGKSPGPKSQNEVSLEPILGLFIDPILSTNIWSDIYGGVGRARRASSDQRSGVCHISLPWSETH